MTTTLADASGLAARYESIQHRIERAAAACSRSPDEVTLVAVSKTFPLECIRDLQALGHADFGENKSQELKSKGAELPGTSAGGSIRWHMIGHLQRNKARDVVGTADVFHGLDSLRLARELDRRCREAGRSLECLVQVNVSGEPTKFGLEPEAVHSFIDELSEFEHLEVTGLMTLAAATADPEGVRPQFRRLRVLAESYSGIHPTARLVRLSMGMSGDFEVAIQEGATHVRIGSAIFGNRSYSQS